MKKIIAIVAALILISAIFGSISAQVIENTSDEEIKSNSDEFLGSKLQPEIRVMITEIERKTGQEIYAEFVRQGEFMLGSSYISEDGIPVILVNPNLRRGDDKKLEAVITHEVLHLHLRAGGYPTFLFSDSVITDRGRAVDTEQDTLNDVTSLIEHQIFKAEMEKFDLYKYVNLAGDTAEVAKRNKGKKDGQADSINYARAILEYQNTADIEEVRKSYAANRWTRALRDGEAIAAFIRTANIKSPREVDAVFLKCLGQLFPLPSSAYSYKLTFDPNKKVGRRMIVGISRQAAVRRKSSRRN